MSDKRNEDLKQFIIPENFMGESRLFQGQLKTRNVVEGGLISGVLAIFFWNVISVPITTKISLVIFFSAPLGLLGLFGVNGDPLSTFIKIFFSWRRKRGLMLFNNEARALKEAPIKLMMSEDGMGDKLRDFLDARKEKKATERASQEMVEGKTFEFAPDSSLEGNYIDEDDDGDGTPSGSAGNRHKTKHNQSFVEVEVLEEDDDTSLELDGFTEDIDSSTVEESGLPLPDLGGADDVDLSSMTLTRCLTPRNLTIIPLRVKRSWSLRQRIILTPKATRMGKMKNLTRRICFNVQKTETGDKLPIFLAHKRCS